MGRKKIGTQFCLTVPDNILAMLDEAARLASNEGKPSNGRDMLSRVLLPGAVRLLSCSGCRSGKCSRHVAMVSTEPSANRFGLYGEIVLANARAAAAFEEQRHRAVDGNPASTAPLNLDKPGQITEDSTEKSFDESVTPKTFALENVDPVKKPERKKRAPSVKCTYPEGFALTDDMRAYAAKYGIGADRAEKVFEDFALHHRSKGSKFVEWTLAWFKWCRNDSDFGPRHGASLSARRSSGQVDPDENFFAGQERRWSQENAS